jgi:hypothetical protein
MDVMHEITLSDEKFASVTALRDLLSRIDSVRYCVWGSFLSSIHFQRQFSGSLEVMVADEQEAFDLLESEYSIDVLHGSVLLDEANGGEPGATMKVRFVETSAKNTHLREFLIEHSELRTCVVARKSGELEKFDISVPRRGPTLISLLLEMDDSPQAVSSIVEKIVWSLNKVGVAPLLRESRYVPQESVYRAADIIEDLFVSHANKTASILHAHSSGEAKTLSASELKTLGRPYAALLRA